MKYLVVWAIVAIACGTPAEDSVDATTVEVDAPASIDAPKQHAFGTIAGPCQRIHTLSDAPHILTTSLDFADDSYDDPSERAQLTAGSRRILDAGNLGGSSLLSEVFAYEVMARCENAALVKTEGEIVYEPPEGKKTDLLVRIGNEKVGVSVTRAVGFPRDAPYTRENARFIEDKLADVNASTERVAAADRWTRQVLVVMAYEPMHAAMVSQAWTEADFALQANTVLYVIVTNGDDAFLY